MVLKYYASEEKTWSIVWFLWIGSKAIFSQPSSCLCHVWLNGCNCRGESCLRHELRILLSAAWDVILEFRSLCALMDLRQRVPEGPTERDPIKRQFHSMTRTPQAPHLEVSKTCSKSQATALTGYESPQHRRYLRAVAESAEHQDDHSCWPETYGQSRMIQLS